MEKNLLVLITYFCFSSQWECKTDLDVAYKFGKTVVSCEGYESSEDQYVLRGSCGLEYNLDYTELGLKKLRESGKNSGFNQFSDYYKSNSSGISGLITIVVLLAIAFGVYKLFLGGGQDSPPPYSENPPYSPGFQGFTNSAGPPPPGFKSGFTGMFAEAMALSRVGVRYESCAVSEIENGCHRETKQICLCILFFMFNFFYLFCFVSL